MSKIKEFFEEHTHLKLGLQHLGIFDGGFMIQVYNTTYDPFEPVFKHFITDFEVTNLNVDFETIIMTPIINWYDDCEKRRKGERL